MNVEELKQEIAQRTGVPVILLTGETAEENIAQAKAFLAYKREHEAQRPKTAQEQFSDWLGGQLEEKDRQTAATYGLQYTPAHKDEAGAALAEIEEAARVEAGGFPKVADGGEVTGLPDARPAREQFAEWLGQKTAFNPFKDGNGWQRLQ